MTIENLVKELNIDKTGTYSKDGSYVIDIDDSGEFGRMYSKLDNNEDLEYIEDTGLLTVHNSRMTYAYGKELQLSLIADFDNDTYSLVISEI